MHIAIIMTQRTWACVVTAPQRRDRPARRASRRRGSSGRHESQSIYRFSAANWSRPGAEVSVIAAARRHLLTQTQTLPGSVHSDQSSSVVGIDSLPFAPVDRAQRAGTANCRGMFCASRGLLSHIPHGGLRSLNQNPASIGTLRERLADVDHAMGPRPR